MRRTLGVTSGRALPATNTLLAEDLQIESTPPGANVEIVGSGNSGTQIPEILARSAVPGKTSCKPR
jgi:hypothetical protein